MVRKFILGLIICSFIYGCSSRKASSASGKMLQHQSSEKNGSVAKNDTSDKKNSSLKRYNDIVNSKTSSGFGFLNVHKNSEKFYFEIPVDILNQDILTVNRIAKAAAEGTGYSFFGYAGDQIGENVIQFCIGKNNKLFVKKSWYTRISRDSSENGLFRSVQNSNLNPIVATFDIKAFKEDSSSLIIDVTEYINADNNDVLFFNADFKKAISFLGAFQPDKSYISDIRAFPTNIEIKTVKTFSKENNSALTYTYEINSSIVLLPKHLMQSRQEDERIGFFSLAYSDFDNIKGVEPVYIIKRWRLEPKKEDVEKYLRGELVEPQKPIVFYIDPATPQKWVPYLIQGVNDWQKAFEKAGFKNAIYALEAPVNNNAWSPDDARHNVIIYKASSVSNAYGPNVCDPRSGEIIETHIQWFHNVIKLLHDWYMIQAGPNDTNARKMAFDDVLMGKLIRFVCAHEVGHTLGLKHNFGASSTVPTAKLRDKKWVEENGFCPSIMDYARFNYVAQPEDSINEKGILPRIGVYDEWAIEWGYRWFPAFPDKQTERTFFNKWVIGKINNDKRLWYGGETESDSRCQSEDLGNNAVIAGNYGIKNLQVVMSNLVDWTNEANAGYDNLIKMQGEVTKQYQRYLQHVIRNIGAWNENPKTREEAGPQFTFNDRTIQKQSVQFLQEQLFTTPKWLMNEKIFSLVGGNGYFPLIKMQKEVLEKLISIKNFGTLLYFEEKHPNEAYTCKEFLADLRSGIWVELMKKDKIDMYRRGLQKSYVAALMNLMAQLGSDAGQRYATVWGSTDILSITKEHINLLLNDVRKALTSQKDSDTRIHLKDVETRLNHILNMYSEVNFSKTATQNSSLGNLEGLLKIHPSVIGDERIIDQTLRCWE